MKAKLVWFMSWHNPMWAWMVALALQLSALVFALTAEQCLLTHHYIGFAGGLVFVLVLFWMEVQAIASGANAWDRMRR